MKTRMILCAAALLSLAACGPKTTTLKGEFEAGKAPEFVNFVVHGVVDTNVVVVDNKFSVQIPICKEEMGTIAASGYKPGQFISDGSVLTIKFGDDVPEVTSSDPNGVQSRYNAYAAWMDEFMASYRRDSQAFANSGLTGAEAKAARDHYIDSVSTLCNDYNKEVFKANTDNIIATTAAAQLDDEGPELLALLESLSPAMKAKPEVEQMINILTVQAETAEGTMFKDFEVVQDPENPEASTVKFSDYIGKGKYMLVDFWASWCGPCKREMPNIIDVYNRFHGENFDVLSVAVWDKPEDTKAMAPQVGIVWNQIINAQRIPTELYGIDGIPHIILFGPDGTILKRGLRGDDIREAVAEALGE
jgi:thiol-disulfide isomerase/thioredoxin